VPAGWMRQRQEQIVDRVAGAGYDTARRTEDEIVMHRRRPSFSRFGIVDSVVVLTMLEGAATKADLVDREEGAVREALLLKIGLPRGLFSAVEVFPITLVGDAESDAVEFVCGGLRNRFAILSMPAVVHAGGREVATFTGFKVWGGAYTASMRRRLLGWVGTAD
jgi:hypothetical protein